MPSANKTPNLDLNQWTGNEYVKRDDFFQDNKKIDNGFGELKKLLENIELVDTKVKITDKQGHFEGETLDKVLDELKDDIDGIETTAKGTSYEDSITQLGASNVQQAIEAIVTKVNSIQELIGQATTRLNTANTEIEADVGNPE